MTYSTVRATVVRNLIRGFAAALLLAISVAARAQVQPATVFGLSPGQTSAIDLELHYAYFHANAPPAECGCFSLNGGGGSLAVNMPHGFSLITDVTTAFANKVDGTTQNIKILDFLAGPRYSYRSKKRWTPFGQVLLGGSEEFSNDAYLGGQKTAFAFSGGGGLTRVLSSHFAWDVQADYVYSQIPNAKNDVQNDLRISTGIVFRIGPR